MSITYRQTGVTDPSRSATNRTELQVAREPHPAMRGLTGAVAGTATGIAAGAGGALLAPGVGLPVFIAMGVFFGAFNGGLLGLITHPARR